MRQVCKLDIDFPDLKSSLAIRGTLKLLSIHMLISGLRDFVAALAVHADATCCISLNVGKTALGHSYTKQLHKISHVRSQRWHAKGVSEHSKKGRKQS